MFNPDQITALQDMASQITAPVVDFLIEDIARRISEAGQLTSTASYQIWIAQQQGVSQKELKKKLQKLLNKSATEIEELLTQAAEVGYDFNISRFPVAEAIPFAQNTSLQQIVKAAAAVTAGELRNFTRTAGFVCPDGKARALTDAYKNACDFAFNKVITGAQDYQSAIREATKGLAEKGIVQIDYKSGRHNTIETAVRRSVLGGISLCAEEVNRQNFDLLGCDGYETSAHAGSAPDHEPYQGRQFSKAEFEKLQAMLVRPIGALQFGCGHEAFGIIMGVNDPQYTDEELEEFRRQNEAGIDFEGKHYTLYEATQRQRSLERSIRKTKRKILIDEATGDAEKLQWDQIRLVRTREEYHRFSKAAGLPEQYERMEKAGFTFKHGSAATKSANAYYKYWSKSIGANESAKTLADYYEMKYNRPDEYKLLKQYAKDVKAGWITPLSGFENYKSLHGRIQSEIVGKTAANGTLITGQVPHFMQRVIGTMVDPEKLKNELQVIRRSGVEIDDIADALFHPESIDDPVKRANGKTSVRFIGTKCVVTINPDEGLLIQTNPRKVRK